MKKLLVLSLVVVLTLSIVAIASAATFDPYVGGRTSWTYRSADGFENNPVTMGNSGLKMKLQGTVKDAETGTWATIGVLAQGWASSTTTVNGPDGDDAGTADDPVTLNTAVSDCHYDFGVNFDKVGIWYTNWENENMKRGQDRLRTIDYAKFSGDPMFDHALANALGVDYKSDTVKVNFGYVFNKANDDASNEMAVAATFLFDGGDVHVAHYADQAENTELGVGAVFNAGIGTLKVDYISASPKDGDSVSQIQVNFGLTDLKLDFTVLADSKYTFETDGGMGYEVKYSGIADGKACVAYRALSASDEADEDANLTDLYFGYKYGIFETRVGSATKGEGDDNGVTYAAIYASLW